MAYGMLAELPPINGLYTSFFPPLLYFLLGTSKHISLGTMAVVALMAGATTEGVALRRRDAYCPQPSMTMADASTASPASTASSLSSTMVRKFVIENLVLI